MAVSKRDAIRAATLGQKAEFKKEVVTYNGVEVEIRQPTHLARKELYAKSVDDSGKTDMLSFLTYAVIYNTYIPDTDELVFEEADYAAMVAKPAGGFLDLFGEKALELLNVADDIEKK